MLECAPGLGRPGDPTAPSGWPFAEMNCSLTVMTSESCKSFYHTNESRGELGIQQYNLTMS